MTFAPQDNWCGHLVDDCTCKAKKHMNQQQEWVTVVIESPYAGDIERNMRYLRACMHDCIHRHEAPYASHALYTQPGVLLDEVPEERKLGIEAGFAFRQRLQKTVVYTDLGYSTGMRYGIKHAEEIGHPIEYRTLGNAWDHDRDVFGERIDDGLKHAASHVEPQQQDDHREDHPTHEEDGSCRHVHYDARDGFCLDCGGTVPEEMMQIIE